MPTFYNFRQNGVAYSFDDVFVPADAFRQGNLFTWGNGFGGQLGINNQDIKGTPVTTFAGGANWKQVGGSGQLGGSVAIKTDGTLWTWGSNCGDNTATNRSTPVTTFAGGTNWKQVSPGGLHMAAIKTDGTLWTWGYNIQGQLGDNTTTDRSTPVTTFVGGTNWKQVSAGFYHTVAIKTDGTLWTWGSNNVGQLGTNNTTTISTPVTTFAGGTNWKQASCGGSGCGAIKTDGTLWLWGSDNFSQLGSNTVNVSKSTPVTTFAGGNNWKQMEGGNTWRMALTYIDSVL